MLYHYFVSFGEICDCFVMTERSSGRSKGFGFVQYVDPANVQKVMMGGPHFLDGKQIDPKPCLGRDYRVNFVEL